MYTIYFSFFLCALAKYPAITSVAFCHKMVETHGVVHGISETGVCFISLVLQPLLTDTPP
jgi:hypothetical protein